MISCTKEIKINSSLSIGGTNRIVFIGGPCVIENEDMILNTAKAIKDITSGFGIGFVFKASFDKANRSSIGSFRGPGLDKGLHILDKVKDKLDIPVLTDVHEPWQCEKVAEVVDIIQIPAFLCRQTELLTAAAKTGKVVNIKKGQFLAPWDMKNVINKVEEMGNEKILVTERGVMFGYNNLVTDMRSLIELRKLGYPVVFDATHSVQKPGGMGDTSGGDREYVAPLIRAAVAVGIDAIFAEVHADPDNALSDGPNMIKLAELHHYLEQMIKIDGVIKDNAIS